MTNILLCGLCPLPFENTRQSYGPGIRTWQLAWSLARAGHHVHLLAMRIPGVYADGEGVEFEHRDGVVVQRVRQSDLLDAAFVTACIAERRPDALVGATIYGSYALALTAVPLPLWADHFGHVMAEAQAKAALEGANWPLGHFYSMTERVARRADHFSVVSLAQKWACVGELGAFGRLNAQNAGHDLVSVIPCAVVAGVGVNAAPPAAEPVLPAGAFAVLWSGGYNVWSDVDTLVVGLERAMDRLPALHFVSTGGQIAGHDERTYARLEAAAAASSHRARMHLLGWLPADQLAGVVAKCHLGVLTERPLYEGMLGSKNRILQWLGGGLPVAYNRVGELAEWLERERLALTFDAGDPDGLCERLIWAAGHQDQLVEMAARGRAAAAERCSFSATTVPLVDWARAPRRAPDHPTGMAAAGAAPSSWGDGGGAHPLGL